MSSPSALLLLLLLLMASTSAFLVPSPIVMPQRRMSSVRAAGLEIGEILPTLEPTLKVTRVSVEDPAADPPICAYLVEADVHGPDVKRTYNQALKAGTMNANFPGFRKGVMPGHALVGVKLTAITASIMDVCRTAMEMHGLENLPVNERKLRMKVPKTTEELAKTYEMGTDLSFACEIDAIGVPGEPKSAPVPLSEV
ncbi:hypothetical protein VYU27_007454 [Nannochloropsis oceanica]